MALYSRIANVNRNPMLAFNHGKGTSIVQCGLLGQTMQSCDTLLAAVQAMERYASLFSLEYAVAFASASSSGAACLWPEDDSLSAG